MSPEKLAFIQGDSSPPASEPSRRGQKPAAETIDLSVSAEAAEVIDQERPRARRRTGNVKGEIPNANEVLNQVLVPLTTRLPRRTVQALRRVCLEQQLQDAKPDSIQEIMEAAVHAWLSKQGAWE
jgi:hypothetical protein